MSVELSVRLAVPEDRADWRALLARSNNGTLFHDPDFLDYHPPDRFRTHHLLFHTGDALCAVLPAALVTGPEGERVLKSPYGASVGGPGIRPRAALGGDPRPGRCPDPVCPRP